MAKQYEIYEQQQQREKLFDLISQELNVETALYPGSYIQISPSLFIPEVVYVDLDKRAAKFFKDPATLDYVVSRKIYHEEPIIRFHHQDYAKSIEEEMEYFDLLISQYAGFVSHHCHQYLRPGGWLVANNSHGDAGIAYLDPKFTLVAVINQNKGKFTLSRKDLDQFFIPKKSDVLHTLDHLLTLKRGLGYTKTASHYVFVYGL